MGCRLWRVLPLLVSACASAPAPPFVSRSHVVVSAPKGLRLQRVSAPMDPVRKPSRIGRAELERARELLSRARQDLQPRQ
jgi:hypothetical protein